MSEEPLQKSLERYDVLDRIAVGGMAEVFLAKAYGAHGFEKTLAIKRILPELASDPEFAARFIAEAKVAVKLSHANVVQVFDFGRIGESLFIAMEFVDGLDLAALLRRFKDDKKQIPLPAAFHIAIEILRALDFAHGHNVVHRDVSPSNILISRAGEVKMADFGIAVAASPHKTSAPGPKRVMGKWRYMSPEQARGDTLDTRSDLFSCASVLYELFTNEKLFPGDEAEDILKNIHDMPIPRMTVLRPGLPSRLDDVLSAALARKPIDRPTRPAILLRSLIELSYESSIMATAMDVAETVANVLPAARVSGHSALDDVIRKQLADQSVIRQTAVTGKPPGTQTLMQRERERGEVSTGMFRKIDIDGVSRLESESDVHANPPDQSTHTRVSAPRARRNSEQGTAMPGDTDLHALYDASQDRDRRTEVGAPPTTGPVPKELVVLDSPPAGITKPPETTSVAAPPADPPRSRRGLAIGIGVAVIAAGGIGVWALTRTETIKIAAALDAGIVVAPSPPDAQVTTTGVVILETTPVGAHGMLGDRRFDTTPITLKDLPPGKATLTIELAGYRTSTDTISVIAHVTLVERRTLAIADATLVVMTTPPGARVMLDGKSLGDTPFAKPVDVPPKQKAELVITKADFEPIRLRIDLEAGKPMSLTRELKPAQKYGLVTIKVSGAATWGNVYHKGKDLGRNLNDGASSLRAIKLPIGEQTLVVRNSAVVGKEATIKIMVDEKTITSANAAL